MLSRCPTPLRRVRLFGAALVVAALALLAGPGCVTQAEAPSDEELAELDAWASTADGKADMPAWMTGLVDWLRDVYSNQMSAIWYQQEHPATAAAALERIRQLAQRAGVDPTRARYPARVQRLVAGPIDHSEINITAPGGTIVRLVGDPKGAGAFLDRRPFAQSVGPTMCLTWTELQTAVEAAYAPGVYGASFVCHTITERVLRALDVGSARFSSLIRTYQASRWVWGPQLPSGNSHDPATWTVSRACP